METDSSSDRRRSYSRRTFIAGVGATAGIAAGIGTTAAQETTTTGTDTSTDMRTVVVESDPEFSGEDESYTNQYMLVSQLTDASMPDGALSDCAAVEWPASQTEPYEVDVLERLDQTTEIVLATDMYTNSAGPSFEIGSTWRIREATPCDGGYLVLQVERIDPDAAGIEVNGTQTTQTTETGTPGFGVAAGVAGLVGGAAAYLRRD